VAPGDRSRDGVVAAQSELRGSARPAALLCVAAALVAYRPLLFSGGSQAGRGFEAWLYEPSYTAPGLVLLGSAWLAFRRRETWRRLPSQRGPTPLVVTLLLVGVVSFTWANLTGAWHLLVPSLIANALAAAIALRGLAGARVALLPVLFLLFALPVPAPLRNELVWGLQVLTTRFAAGLVDLLGGGAHVHGVVIERPGRLFLVIEACSGFRMIRVFAALGLLGRGLFPPSALRGALALGLGGLLGFFLNEVRAAWIVLGPPSVTGVSSHVAQGIAVLIAGVPMIHWLNRRLERLPVRPSEPTESAPQEATSSGGSAWGVAGALLAGLLVLSFALPRGGDAVRFRARLPERIPQAHADWVSSRRETDLFGLGSVRYTELLSRTYERGPRMVDLFVGVSPRTDVFASPFAPSARLPDSGWTLEERQSIDLATLERRVRSMVVSDSGRRRLVYAWQLGDTGLAAETLRSFLAIDAGPWGGARPGAMVRVGTPMEGEGESALEDARSTLDEFLGAFREPLRDLALAIEAPGDGDGSG
jgi:EpsI family protein